LNAFLRPMLIFVTLRFLFTASSALPTKPAI
jgi:hypothetical protein